ncbi:MAG: hypothetical protein AAFQ67_02260 [Pseudomonadota bacterium]
MSDGRIDDAALDAALDALDAAGDAARDAGDVWAARDARVARADLDAARKALSAQPEAPADSPLIERMAAAIYATHPMLDTPGAECPDPDPVSQVEWAAVCETDEDLAALVLETAQAALSVVLAEIEGQKGRIAAEGTDFDAASYTLDRIAAHLREGGAEAPDPWRPMESAPTAGWQDQGGPDILGVDADGIQQVTCAIDVGDDYYRQGWFDPQDCGWVPVAWMPLPPPPKGEKA